MLWVPCRLPDGQACSTEAPSSASAKRGGLLSQMKVEESKTPRVAKFTIISAQQVESGEGQGGVRQTMVK